MHGFLGLSFSELKPYSKSTFRLHHAKSHHWRSQGWRPRQPETSRVEGLDMFDVALVISLESRDGSWMFRASGA